MDFFQHQDDARRRTGWLVAMFVLAVLGIIAAVYAATAALVLWFTAEGAGDFDPSLLWHPNLLGGVVLGVLIVVSSGSLYKIAQLSGGGETVAHSLGGRMLDSDTTDPDERKLLNVVEEMSIASGVPVPPVYVMDEESGINAFAAGYAPNRAVIGVTRGAIQKLSRDELQGVIAHEFSHILNGDMRLNVRLIGVIHGILIIGIIGYYIMRAAASGSRHSSSRKKGNPLPLILFGLALMGIGFIGTLFGRLIKAGVSRQREYLADAAAVQFTRHPDGLGGALQKIGAYAGGSKLGHPKAEQLSHMFFAQGVSLTSLLATHPPLPDRIRRLLPSWDGRYPEVAEVEVERPTRRKRSAARPAGVSASLAERIAAAREAAHAETAASALATPPAIATAIEQVGQPTPAHLALAAALLESVPDPVQRAARDPDGARAVIYAMLLDGERSIRDRQLQRLRESAGDRLHDAAAGLAAHLDGADRAARLPLIDLAVPALRRLSPKQYEQFRRHVVDLVQADQRVDLFEWTLHRILLRHLTPSFEDTPPPKVRYSAIKRVLRPIAVILSALAHVGHRDADATRRAFDEARRRLGVQTIDLLPREECGLRGVDDALEKLEEASPGIKKRFLEACAACIATDAEVTAREGELLRAIADALDCPMPPLLPDQRLV